MRVSGWHLQLRSSYRALASSVHKDPAYKELSAAGEDPSASRLEVRQGDPGTSPADGSWDMANKKVLAASKSASNMLLAVFG